MGNNTLEEILNELLEYFEPIDNCAKEYRDDAIAQIEKSYISKEAVVRAIGAKQVCHDQCKHLTGWCDHVVHNRYRSEILVALELDDKETT